MRLPLTIALLGCPLLGLSACHQPGPAEQAGQSIDKAGQSIADTLNPPQGPAQAAGRKIDRALGN